MRILDKYIVLKILKTYFFILIAFAFLYIISDIFSRLDDLIKNNIPVSSVLQYYGYSIPFIIVKVSSFSLLISCLYILGVLNKTNEILAIRASGVSILNLSASIITLATVIALCSLYLQDKVVPLVEKKTRDINLTRKAELPREQIRNLAFLGNNGNIYFIGTFDPAKQTLSNITLFQHNQQGQVASKIVAQEAVFNGTGWDVSGIMRYEVDPEGRIINLPQYVEHGGIDLSESPREVVARNKEGYEMMSLKEMRRQLKQFKYLGTQGMLITLRIEIQKKIAEAFNHIFLVLGALPFALKIRRRHVNFSLMGMAIIFGLFYYVIFSISIALGKVGIFAPELSAWIANIFFGVSGIVGLIDLR